MTVKDYCLKQSRIVAGTYRSIVKSITV